MYKLLMLFLLLPWLSACETAQYYGQLAQGQWQLLSQSQDIDDLLSQKQSDQALQQKLRLVQQLLVFADAELALNNNGSYSQYVDIDRAYVVWNVFAAGEFTVSPRQWCFPIAGCVSYRGYFQQDQAQDYAQQLQQQGLETYIGGVAAYSTLGWLNDPVLSSFVYKSEVNLANLIFHELAHQQLYLSGDSEFNESFATVTAQIGVQRWLRYRRTPEKFAAYQHDQARYQDFVKMLINWRHGLQAIYRNDSVDKRDKKAVYLASKELEYEAFVRRWNNYRGYDSWIKSSQDNGIWHDLNNAKLGTINTYQGLVPALSRFAQGPSTADEMRAFFQRCQDLAKLPPAQRRQALGLNH